MRKLTFVPFLFTILAISLNSCKSGKEPVKNPKNRALVEKIEAAFDSTKEVIESEIGSDSSTLSQADSIKLMQEIKRNESALTNTFRETIKGKKKFTPPGKNPDSINTYGPNDVEGQSVVNMYNYYYQPNGYLGRSGIRFYKLNQSGCYILSANDLSLLSKYAATDNDGYVYFTFGTFSSDPNDAFLKDYINYYTKLNPNSKDDPSQISNPNQLYNFITLVPGTKPKNATAITSYYTMGRICPLPGGFCSGVLPGLRGNKAK